VTLRPFKVETFEIWMSLEVFKSRICDQGAREVQGVEPRKRAETLDPKICDQAVGEAQRFQSLQPAKEFEVGIRDVGRFKADALETLQFQDLYDGRARDFRATQMDLCDIRKQVISELFASHTNRGRVG